jgi:predicted dehydrogenase/threonine dehydrogenase-like Zn-dependent dehydrogenase
VYLLKQLILENGRVVVKELPDPTPDTYEVVVANAYSAVSIGTERSMLLSARKGSLSKILVMLKNEEMRSKALEILKRKGLIGAYRTWKQFFQGIGGGVPPGYSSAGYVVAVGRGVREFDVGDRVACAGAGYASHAELVTVPTNLVIKVPSGVDLLDASFTTIGSIALHALRLSKIQPSEGVAIIGTGLIGLIGVQLARNVFGAKTIAIDVDNEKIELAKKLGADKGIVLSSKKNVINEVMEVTGGIGVDVAIIAAATKSSKPVNLGLELLRDRGKLVVVGDVPVNVSRELMYRKEATLIVSRSYGPGRYDETYEVKGMDYPIGYVRWTLKRNMQSFLELVKEGKVNLKPLISKIITLDEAPSFYEDLVSGRSKYIGVAISYEVSKYLNGVLKHRVYVDKPRPEATVARKSIAGRRIKLGIIGAGSFVNNMILPILLGELKDMYEVVAVHAKHPQNCVSVAKKIGAQYCTTDYREILADEKVDAVIIATRHDTHARIVVEAINSGKAIFVEKPLALNEEELEEVYSTYKKKPVPITVDFNRRFSPLTLKAKEELATKPIYGIYRVNAGFLPPTHWTQDPEVGGGRILGEVCHFVDFFNFMVNSKLVDLVVETIPVDNAKVVAKDNTVINMKWDDGSLTSIHYFAIGSPSLPKEYIELHSSNNSSIVIDDFVKMIVYKGDAKETIKLRRQDKGHRNHLVEFAKLVRGEQSAIPSFEDYIYTMKVTFEIEKRLRKIIKL